MLPNRCIQMPCMNMQVDSENQICRAVGGQFEGSVFHV